MSEVTFVNPGTNVNPCADLGVKKEEAREKPVKSPCISLCALNEDDVCQGCYRTGQEISHWGAYNNDERRGVLVRAGERARAVNPFL